MDRTPMAAPQESILDLISPDCLSVELIQSGKGCAPHDGWIHRKQVPYSILAIPVVGSYVLECPLGTARAKAGEGWLSPPDLPLTITHVGDPRRRNRMEMKWIHFHFTLFNSVDIMALLESPLHIGRADGSLFLGMIEELFALASSSENHVLQLVRRNEIAFRALALLCSISRARPGGLSFLSECRKLRPVFDRMKEDAASRTDVASLAKLANLSPSRFHAVFRKTTGMGPMKCRMKLRLAEAFRLIMTGGLPLKEVAAQTGFCNEFHLSREFKKRYGKSPLPYRKAAEKSFQGTFY
jgi:AraC-like DNA-binding protein